MFGGRVNIPSKVLKEKRERTKRPKREAETWKNPPYTQARQDEVAELKRQLDELAVH